MKKTPMRPKDIKEAQNRPYSLPPLELLTREAPSTTSCEDNSDQADRIIREFSRRGVNVILNEIVTASRLTTFLFAFEDGELDQARRIDESMRITLEMALETSGVTLQVPLPDSSLFAVHVPKKDRKEAVCLVRFVEAARKANLRIPCVLGEDFRGCPQVIDLSRDCHQLVGGQTGSGKSMFLKATALTIAMTRSPEEVKFVIVDGKGLDLSLLGKLPHCACPVIMNPENALSVLRWLNSEMIRRQTTLRNADSRDLWHYQSLAKQDDQKRQDTIPAILVMIDEVQALLGEGQKEIEHLLRRLTQQGRACGIIVILASQRPSVDILQGSIKANLPGRISFRLPTQHDSRVILGQTGAEVLTGAGDLIAMENSVGPLQRFQAPLVDESEIEGVCHYLSQTNGRNLPIPVDLSVDYKQGRECCSIVSSHNELRGTTDKGGRLDFPSRFARVRFRSRQLFQLLENQFPGRAVTSRLVYVPFLQGSVRTGWWRKSILFEPSNGFFVICGNPFEIVLFRGHINGLNGELELLRAIRKKGRIPSLNVLTATDPVLDERAYSHLWFLVERGLAEVSPKGITVGEKFLGLPFLRQGFEVDFLPEPDSSMLCVNVDIDNCVAELRHEMAALWETTPQDFYLVGMPFHLVLFDCGQRRLFVAWQRTSVFRRLEHLLVDGALLQRIPGLNESIPY